jgi:hypothetical protein
MRFEKLRGSWLTHTTTQHGLFAIHISGTLHSRSVRQSQGGFDATAHGRKIPASERPISFLIAHFLKSKPQKLFRRAVEWWQASPDPTRVQHPPFLALW